MKLATIEIKNEWNRTSAPPICIRGVHRGGFTFLPLQSGVSLRFVLCLLNGLWEFFPVKIMDYCLPHLWYMCSTSGPATAVLNARGYSYKSQKITYFIFFGPDVFLRTLISQTLPVKYAISFMARLLCSSSSSSGA
jgi:hypothetical protein